MTISVILGAAVIILAAQNGLAGMSYPIVDTGQTNAYGNYEGQDAHYSANSPSYKDNGNGTVTDNVTDLMWTKTPGAKMTFAEAVKNASKCRTSGHEDWRLPTIKELYSLIKLDGLDPDPTAEESENLKPFIDSSVFDFHYGDRSRGERIIDSQFATCTKYVSTTMNGNKTLFGVNFADGRIKGYPIKSRRGEKTFFVLFVRGRRDYGVNKFEDNGNGTIADIATGLMWMKADSGKGMTWPNALDYAEAMEFAGHSDWRLPNAKELQSIVDYTRSPNTTDSAAIDPVFESTEIENENGKKDFAQYWSSSSHVSIRSNNSATYFAFGRALGWMGKDGQKKLLDVHGAGSQRSDPKTGDASKFPYGRGPQGDVVRIENMVRLVRGGTIEGVEASVVEETMRRERDGQRQSQDQRGEQQGQRGGSFMERADQNRDGKVTKDEFRGPVRQFDRFDTNNDGYISADEAPKGPPKRR